MARLDTTIYRLVATTEELASWREAFKQDPNGCVQYLDRPSVEVLYSEVQRPGEAGWQTEWVRTPPGVPMTVAVRPYRMPNTMDAELGMLDAFFWPQLSNTIPTGMLLTNRYFVTIVDANPDAREAFTSVWAGVAIGCRPGYPEADERANVKISKREEPNATG